MPIYTHGGYMSDKMGLAVLIALTLLGVLMYLCGLIYDGVKHGEWTLHTKSLDCSFIKMLGAGWTMIMLVGWVLCGLVVLIYKLI